MRRAATRASGNKPLIGRWVPMISGVVVRKSYFGGMPSESGISETWIGLLFFAGNAWDDRTTLQVKKCLTHCSSGEALIRRRYEHITHAAHCPNGIGVSRITFYLASQTSNPQIDGAIE